MATTSHRATDTDPEDKPRDMADRETRSLSPTSPSLTRPHPVSGQDGKVGSSLKLYLS